MAAAFEHVEEADEIGLRIGVRIDQRMAHAGLRREMDDVAETVRREQRRAIASRSAMSICSNRNAGKSRELGKPRPLQRRVVIGVEIVEADDPMPSASSRRATCIPMKPAAPVTNTCSPAIAWSCHAP